MKEELLVIKDSKQETIGYVPKQGQIFKKFKDTEATVENVGKNRSTVHFNTGLYKFLQKYTALKSSTQSSHYFKNNFKVIKTVFKNNMQLFSYTRRTV